VNLEMAERRFRPGLISIAPHLKTCGMPEEAADVRYGFGRGGKVFKVESKDDFRKRHNGRSPDRWDATVLAFAELRRGAGDADLSGWGWA
jgi:hypothetical protein